MTLGLTSTGAVKIKTDEEGGGLRAVECACCESPPIACGYTCIPTPASLKSILQNWKTVVVTYDWPADPDGLADTMSGSFELTPQDSSSFLYPMQMPPPRNSVSGSLGGDQNCICFYIQERRLGASMYLAPAGSVQIGGGPFPYPLVKSGDGPLNITINGITCPAWCISVGLYVDPFAWIPTISLQFEN